MEACDKCNEKMESPTFFTEAGAIYYLCDKCREEFSKYPTTSLSLFLSIDPESQVYKNIKEARERRSRGESLWK